MDALTDSEWKIIKGQLEVASFVPHYGMHGQTPILPGILAFCESLELRARLEFEVIPTFVLGLRFSLRVQGCRQIERDYYADEPPERLVFRLDRELWARGAIIKRIPQTAIKAWVNERWGAFMAALELPTGHEHMYGSGYDGYED